MKPMELLTKLAKTLSPEFQRRYDKALRDWEAGKNLEEAAAVIYVGASKAEIARLVNFQESEFAERRKKGQKLVILGLGTLTHDGERFAVKKKTLLYQKSAVIVRIDRELASDELVGRVWDKFCQREETLVGELESAIAKYYREIRQRPNLTGHELPHLNRDADIWVTLGKPEICFRERDGNVELELSWSPDWEEEHGLYVYLSGDAKIRHVGEVS